VWTLARGPVRAGGRDLVFSAERLRLDRHRSEADSDPSPRGRFHAPRPTDVSGCSCSAGTRIRASTTGLSTSSPYACLALGKAPAWDN
jgi:hypothetical protein